MMSKTHIAIGLASAVTVLNPVTARNAAMVVAGAAVGSLICDIDSRSRPKERDALIGRLIVCLIVVAVAVYAAGHGLLKTGSSFSVSQEQAAGLIILLVTGLVAAILPHRSFSHSILALVLYFAGLSMIFPQILCEAFAVAFISHLALDLLNKKDVKLLWPVPKGICLHLCYADGIMNKVLLAVGCVWLGVEVAQRV